MNKQAKVLHDQALALMPEGASHPSDTCPFCTPEIASATGTPSGSDRPATEEAPNNPDTASEGGTEGMDTITLETHKAEVAAAVAKAVADALAPKDAEIATLTSALENKTGEVASLTTKVEELSSENTKLNANLDKAQIDLKTATDEAAALKDEKAQLAETARLADVASARSEQATKLGIFDEKFVTDSAAKWAQLDDAAWTEKVSEWAALKGTSTPEAQSTDSASALTGTNEGQDDASNNSTTNTPKPRAGRAVLGLN
jgi:hypothetical protein